MGIEFKYNETELEDGYYILEVTDPKPKKVIAEFCGSNWIQLGIDYDVWQYRWAAQPNITILAKIDLDTLTITELS